MTASIITPTKLTDAMLTSSNAPEDEHAVWAFGTFAVGNRRIMTTGIHRVYECLVAHTSSNAAGAPNVNTSGATPNWLDIAPTNRWAMFDEKIGTITTQASPITVVLEPGPTGGLALLELQGTTATVTAKDQAGGQQVYSRVINLDGTEINSFFEWFFEEYQQKTDVTLTDIPSQYFNIELTVSIESSAGVVACGVCHVGKVYELGKTQMGATSGMISYSVKETDPFGNLTILKRQNSKRASWQIMIDKSRYQRISRLLYSIDAVLCIYIATTEPGFEPLIVYGIMRDFSIAVTYPEHFMTSLELEGLAQ
jgi:hypothetical protein